MKRSKFKWQNCMSLRRQFPVNISQSVNSRENVEGVYTFPKYPSIHQPSI
jgi:hypothetical protein